MKILRDRFTLAGILCVLLFALDVSVNLGDWWELLWFCPVASLLAALAFFRRNALLLTICLVLAVPAQLPWVWDFLLSLFGVGMGRTEELLRCGPFIFWGSIVVHSAVVPLAAWGVFRLGFDRRALVPAMLFGAALLTATYFFSPEYKNVNCVFYSCDGENYNLERLSYFLIMCLLRWAALVPASFFVLNWLYRNHLVPLKGKDANNA